jgi:hypothetical protein
MEKNKNKNVERLKKKKRSISLSGVPGCGYMTISITRCSHAILTMVDCIFFFFSFF